MNRLVINNEEMSFRTVEVSMQEDAVTIYVQTDENAEKTAVSPVTAAPAPAPVSVLSLNYQNFDLFLTSLLSALNTPAHLSGYQYLRRSIELAMDEPLMFTSISKTLYPRLAEEFEVGTPRIERSLHGVIMKILKGEAVEEMKEFFGNEYSTLSARRNNAYVISLFVTQIKLLLAGHPLETPRTSSLPLPPLAD